MNILELIAGPILKIIDKVVPDPQAKAAMQLKMLELNQAGEFKQLEVDMQTALAQIAVNQEEAKSPGIFKGGWRPFAGWVGGIALAYQTLLRPLLPWIMTVLGLNVPPLPVVDTQDLMVILTGMLGLGGMRTYERWKGVEVK